MRAQLFKAVIAATILAMVTSLVGISRAEAAEGQVVHNMLDNGITADDLVDILVGDDTQVSNINVHGRDYALGTFAGFTSLGFASGVVLSTGYVSSVPFVGPYYFPRPTPEEERMMSSVPGPNRLDGSTTGETNSMPEADDDLDTLIDVDLLDVTYLEFDFIATTTNVQFQYIFASEEYPEFVNSTSRPSPDVFGLFINGVNCATVSDGANITIDNINSVDNADLYRDNTLASGAPIDTGFNGMTVPLTCSGKVTKGAVNHVKFAIADAGSWAHDSAVFLLEGSFTTDPPTPAGDDEDEVNANGPGDTNKVAIDVLENDQPGATLVSITQPANGTAEIINQDGGQVVVYTPKVGFSGKDPFTYTVTAPEFDPMAATVTVTVAPVAKADSTTSGQTGITIPVLTNDVGTGLTLNTVTQPSHGTVTKSGNQVVYTPTAGYSGPDSFTYTVIDTIPNAEGTVSAPATVTITVQAGPVAQPIARDVSAGDSVTITVPGQVTLGEVTTPARGQVSKSGNQITYTAPATAPADPVEFTYTITDSLGSPATGTITITVVPLPTTAPDTAAIDQGQTATINVLGNDTGRNLTLVSVADPATGSAAIENGQVTYTPPAGFSGNVTLSYEIADDMGKPATGSATVTVRPSATLDRATAGQIAKSIPVLANDIGSNLTLSSVTQPAHGTTAISGNEIVYTVTPGWAGPDSFSYALSDGVSTATATVEVTVVAGPVAGDFTIVMGANKAETINVPANGNAVTAGNGAHGTTAVAGSQITYTPAAGWSGADSFQYVVTDSLGSSTPGTVNVTVVAPPVATDDPDRTTGQGKAITIDVLANDQGSPGSTNVALTSAANGANGTAVVADGLVTYTPAATFSGTDTFTYVITDNFGNTDEATVTVTVVASPAAVGDVRTIGQGRAVTIDVLANDAIRTGSPVALTAGNGAHGTTTVANNQVTYTPAADWSGTDSFTYVIADGYGNSSTAIVSLTIVAAPVAVNDALTAYQGAPVVIDVLANDTPHEGTLRSITQPNIGSIEIVDGKIAYTPAGAGTATFTYVIADGYANSSTGTVTVTVVAPLVAKADAAAADQDQGVTIDVLANDTGWDFSLLSASQPAHGTTTVTGGKVVYTPAAGYSGSDTFTYVVRDGMLNLATGTVTVTIAPKVVVETGGSVLIAPPAARSIHR